ncbi:protein phosphatase 1 regulatory subunit 3B [Cololabis saira]|uniref:protein phosphatase 1 regulatory subunit 3B n=1 Tax=Cololabis saira TaxID=129043 RepID=UPI002AD456E1|nr:protein phosphatase 1 regulatory subunit 3B [Cololabis saira]
MSPVQMSGFRLVRATRLLLLTALCILQPESTMPKDMAMPIYLSNEDFVCSPASKTSPSAQSFQLKFNRSTCLDCPKSESKGDDIAKTKKRLTFADQKGLPLTTVKTFEISDPIYIPLNIQQMQSSALALSGQESKLVLDFTQPSSDYLIFHQNLDKRFVSLEHCVLKETAFAGTVKVKNVSFEKSVKLRVTSDRWKSHMDVTCEYVKDAYPSSYSDTFSFQVSLPSELQPHERVEFAVCYEVDGCQYWDNNQGKNYHIVWSYMKRDRHSDSPHFDLYGSPTCSRGLLPDWPSYTGYENFGPYY